ncbi:MAG TPA: HAD-IB family hydrolase [Acidimicrobiales bacterium]|nr:HAD-IB family hydrolase [Acidimicrobiales bacterium]
MRPPERVPGRDVVAAFDFDGTLTRGGSVWKFLSMLCGRDEVVSAGIVLLPKLVRAALFGGSAADEAKEALFVRTLAGRGVDDVAGRAAAFGVAHYHHRSRTKVRARLDWHRRQGHRIVLVSASPEYYVRAVGDELGVDGVVATRLEVDGHGRLTGRFEGGNCRGARKLAGLQQWMEASSPRGPVGEGTRDGAPPAPTPYLWAYGNSAGDLEMLEAADVGVDAGRLGRLGKLRRFRRLGDILTAW